MTTGVQINQGTVRRVLLPTGEGGPKGRMRAYCRWPAPSPAASRHLLPGGDWSLDICRRVALVNPNLRLQFRTSFVTWCRIRNVSIVTLRGGFPSFAKEGWLRPSKQCREATLAGADGVVGSSHRLSEVERTTPSAPSKERDHLLDGAATPPSPRRGISRSNALGKCPNSRSPGGRRTRPA